MDQDKNTNVSVAKVPGLLETVKLHCPGAAVSDHAEADHRNLARELVMCDLRRRRQLVQDHELREFVILRVVKKNGDLTAPNLVVVAGDLSGVLR